MLQEAQKETIVAGGCLKEFPDLDWLQVDDEFLPVNDNIPEPERWIWVTFKKEGIHCYPAAGTDPTLKSVDFLQWPHRHIFHFKVSITVNHNDRDIEFIMFKRELEDLYSSGTLQLNHQSCEMLAEELHKYISQQYPGRSYKVEVSEDGENGCSLEWINNEDI
jgi:hypothetical protein